MGLPIPTAVIVAATTLPAVAFAALAVWMLTRKARQQLAARRQRAVTRAVLVDQASQANPTPAPHKPGCTCLDCWNTYVDRLVDQFRWDQKPHVIRRRDRKAGTR